MNIMGKEVAKTWTFESDSSPGKVYETVLYRDGTTSCGCRGWTMKKGNAERTCKHTRLVEQGTADAGCIGSTNYDSLYSGNSAKAAKYGLNSPASKTKVPVQPVHQQKSKDNDKPVDGVARKILW